MIMTAILSNWGIVGLAVGITLAMVTNVDSTCELLDHEPANMQQVIEFKGGKLTFNASLGFFSDNSATKKFVALKSTGEAEFIRVNPRFRHVVAKFDCAKLEFMIRVPEQELTTNIDYTATMPGQPCQANAIKMKNLEAKSPTSSYLAHYCSKTPDQVLPLLAIHGLKFEIPE